MPSRLLAVALAAVLFSVLPVGAMAKSEPTSDELREQAASLREEAAALIAEAEELEAQADEMDAESADEASDGQSGLRQPTPEEQADLEPVEMYRGVVGDCFAMLREPSSSASRWAFVGTCTTAFAYEAGVVCFNDGVPFMSVVQSEMANGTPREEALEIAARTPSTRTSLGELVDLFDDRLQEEWSTGDVPQGVPEAAPSIEDIMNDAGCTDYLASLG